MGLGSGGALLAAEVPSTQTSSHTLGKNRHPPLQSTGICDELDMMFEYFSLSSDTPSTTSFLYPPYFAPLLLILLGGSYPPPSSSLVGSPHPKHLGAYPTPPNDWANHLLPRSNASMGTTRSYLLHHGCVRMSTGDQGHGHRVCAVQQPEETEGPQKSYC